MKRLISYAMMIAMLSCKKYMTELPSSSMNIPNTIEEVQLLLNDVKTMNVTPGLTELSADDYFMQASMWATKRATQKNAYIWADDIYEDDDTWDDWDRCYRQVLNANLALEGLEGIARSPMWNDCKGQALFFRSFAYYNLAQLFCKAYHPVNALTDLGIPLRLKSDVNVKVKRGTVQQTYGQIIEDLKKAVGLLSVGVAQNTAPSKPAAYALLARTYQAMNEHQLAGLYADSCLQLKNTLMNYTLLPVATSKPFQRSNEEIIFLSELTDQADVLYSLASSGSIINEDLFNSYLPNDLRVNAFFHSKENAQRYRKRGYAESVYPFSGIASDEIILIRAETFARAGNVAAAMEQLNRLLQNRWVSGAFVPLTAQNAAEALQLILQERRKELPFRSLRWTDLRRLNAEGRNIRISRRLDSATYYLEPNSARYVLPIPENMIRLGGIEQNPR